MSRGRRSLARRFLVALTMAVILLAGVTLGGGWWVRTRVQHSLAGYLDHRLPGARAQVDIASFPFLVHLVASGTILEVSVHLNRVSAGPLSFNGIELAPITFSDIDIHVHDVRLSRSELLHRRVVIERIHSAEVIATIRQGALDRAIGLPVTLGQGTVGIGGLTLPATIVVRDREITLNVPNEISVTVVAPSLAVLPCIGRVAIVPGALRLTCSLQRLPPVMAGISVTF